MGRITVKADFWCYPRPPTVGRGWPAEWFAIEAKAWGLQDQRKKTCARLLHQAIRYRESLFPTEHGNRYPSMVLITPPFLTLVREQPTSETAYTAEDYLNGYAFGLAKLAAMFRIGELQVLGDNYYEVYFRGINCWWTTTQGRVGPDVLGKENRHASR